MLGTSHLSSIINKAFCFVVVHIIMAFYWVYCLFLNKKGYQYNFIKSYINVLRTSYTTNGDFTDVLRNTILFIDHIINSLTLRDRTDLITDFFIGLRGNDTYAGSISREEYGKTILLAKNNKISVRYTRYVFNMLFCLVRFIVSPLIYEGVAKDTDYEGKDSIPIMYFEKFLDKGITHMSNITSISNVREDIIAILMVDNLYGAISAMNNVEYRNFNIDKKGLYNLVFKMPFIGSRAKQIQERDMTVSGYDKHLMNKVRLLSPWLLTDYEKHIAKIHNEPYPWRDRIIFGMNSNTELYKMCKYNRVYIGSGRSGSSFQLLLMLYALAPDIEKKEENVKKLLMFFIYFHVISGTHSVLECVLSFIDVLKYLQNVKIHENLTIELVTHLNTLLSKMFVDIDWIQFNKTQLTSDIMSKSMTVPDSVIFSTDNYRHIYVETNKY